MKKLYEIKGYLSTYKEEAPVYEIICADNTISSLEKLKEILDMEDSPGGVATNPKAIIRDAKLVMENRRKTLTEIEKVLDYYKDLYGRMEYIIKDAEKKDCKFDGIAVVE